MHELFFFGLLECKTALVANFPVYDLSYICSVRGVSLPSPVSNCNHFVMPESRNASVCLWAGMGGNHELLGERWQGASGVIQL